MFIIYSWSITYIISINSFEVVNVIVFKITYHFFLMKNYLLLILCIIAYRCLIISLMLFVYQNNLF